MIFDKLENLEKYESAHPRFADAIAFLRSVLNEAPADGKREMPNCDVAGAVSVNVFHLEPKPWEASKPEAHERYIDIQVVLEGEEYMYVPAREGLEITEPYNADTDCKFFSSPRETAATRLCVPQGYFAVFFAGELHVPGVATPSSPKQVRKAVVKVLH